MASARGYAVVLLASLALASAQDKRPNMQEWKEKQAAKADAGKAQDARQAKTGAVDKVIGMMEDLQKSVIAEGLKEAKTYDKFACYCKDQTRAKTKAIKKGEDRKAALAAEIKRLNSERDHLDDSIQKLEEHIEKEQKTQKELKEARAKTLAEYEKNAADLSAAISGVREATKVLKASKTDNTSPSLVQLQSVSETVKTAVMLADALGLKSAKTASASFLQQAPNVAMEDYKFHSAGIVDTLEQLTQDFVDEKNKVDADEVQSVQEHTMAMQESTDIEKLKTKELKEANERREQVNTDIAESSQEYSTTSADLIADQKYLAELSKGCSEKSQTWNQRSLVRANELTAITEAMDIVKATVLDKTQASTIRFAQTGSTIHLAAAVTSDDSALDAIEAEAESEEAPTFLQRRSKSSTMLSIFARKHQAAANAPDSDGARQMVASLLRDKGMKLKSTLLLSLASEVGSDPFGKVKKLIQELIERLLTEAANEANQKGWCDKAMADAERTRDNAAEKASAFNARMAKLEATRNTLQEELGALADEIQELNAAQADAKKMRAEEKEENKETVREATQGLEAANIAIGVLERFYGTAKKATIKLSLSQGPFDDAPDAGFKTGEAYTGAGAESGIVGMMQVIASDFQRTITQTEEAEKAAAKAHLEFLTESSMALAEKKMAHKEKTKYKDEAIESLEEADNNLQTQTSSMVNAVKELMELKPACIDTGMSYADRVAMREQEIASLKKALCIFGAFKQYGPDGAADAC